MNIESWNAVMPTDWHLLRTAPASGPHNMAVDATLLDAAATRGTGVWRCYGWSLPTISFGRNEMVNSRFDDESVARAGFDVVRRPTGGRALLHSGEVTYSVTIPLAREVAWQAAYAAVNGLLLAAVRSLGVAAELVPTTAPAVRPDGPVCFEHPAPGEIVVHGAKLAGSAVWREGGAYLQHGSILLADRQSLLSDAMRATAGTGDDAADRHPQGPPPAASLNTLLSTPVGWDTVADAMEQCVRDLVTRSHGGSLRDGPPALRPVDVSRHERHFRDRTWLWRR